MADYINENSNGTLTATAFYDTALGDATSMVQGLQQGTVAVSYTHLDVYKRQEESSSSKKYVFMSGTMSNSFFIAISDKFQSLCDDAGYSYSAVSYTHLDVYKRQAETRLDYSF